MYDSFVFLASYDRSTFHKVSAPPTRAHCRHFKSFTSKQRHVPKYMSRFRFLVLPSLQLYFYTFKLTQYCLRYTCVIFKHASGKCKKRSSSHSSFSTYPEAAKHTTISCTLKRNAAFFSGSEQPWNPVHLLALGVVAGFRPIGV